MIIFFLGKFTSTVRLTWKLWLVSLAIGFIRFVQAVFYVVVLFLIAFLSPENTICSVIVICVDVW